MKNSLILIAFQLFSTAHASKSIITEIFYTDQANHTILSLILNDSSEATIYDSKIVDNMNFTELSNKHLTQLSFYPRFCKDLVTTIDISDCASQLQEVLPPGNFSYLYMNGDQNSSDFKIIHLIHSSNTDMKTLTTLIIQDERLNAQQ